jgi:nitrate/nitrite-specific signal transduction histidine kinase
MNLSQIIETNETGKQSILTELLYKYKKSLYIYYKDQFCCEPVLMVTDVFNACQYALIVPSNEFNEAIDTYLEDSEMSEDEKHNQTELISFQSIMLSDF